MTERARYPDFFVLGAMKAGTTSLYHYVTQHPGVLAQADKEPMFFTSDGTPPAYAGPDDQRLLVDIHQWDEPSYLRLFERPDGHLAGDFSVLYLPLPAARDRILDAVPDAPLVVILRDPVERARSAWTMWRRTGPETLGFADALAAEEERRAAGWAPLWWYRELGFYGAQVAHWLERVDRERLLVLRTEDLDRDPAGTVARVYAHIGADTSFVPDLSRRLNVGGTVPRNTRLQRWMRDTRSTSKRLAMRVPQPLRQQAGKVLRRANAVEPPEDPAVVVDLRRGYADDLERLMDLTGVDVAHWLP